MTKIYSFIFQIRIWLDLTTHYIEPIELSRLLAILNAKNKKQRKAAYVDLLKVTDKVLGLWVLVRLRSPRPGWASIRAARPLAD